MVLSVYGKQTNCFGWLGDGQMFGIAKWVVVGDQNWSDDWCRLSGVIRRFLVFFYVG